MVFGKRFDHSLVSIREGMTRHSQGFDGYDNHMALKTWIFCYAIPSYSCVSYGMASRTYIHVAEGSLKDSEIRKILT